VPQGGLLVNPNSVLTVTESGFPGNTVDITFPVGMSSRYVKCVDLSGEPCVLTITNTPPPPTPPTTAPSNTTTTAAAGTSIVPPTAPNTLPITIPNTLPATGSSDASQLVLFGLVLVPLGAVLVAVTRRRARTS
jgi:LPXTG-motif cell wall-anchored protein